MSNIVTILLHSPRLRKWSRQGAPRASGLGSRAIADFGAIYTASKAETSLAQDYNNPGMEGLPKRMLDRLLRIVQTAPPFVLRTIRNASVEHGYSVFQRMPRALAWVLTLVATTLEAAVEPQAAAMASLYIREYRVAGARILTQKEVGEAVYPFLGPGRTVQDVEGAREAIEKAYKEKGFQTVTVEVPEQTGRGGIVVLKVVENKVGRLRVHGSRYFSLTEIKKHAPSLAEGTVPNFNDITRDIVALNQWPDREITPTLKPGVVPGTVDIDLTVKEKLPLHGSIELNNRNSADTTPLRLNASLSYGNLWQLGHSAGFSFQVAPERPEDATIYSGYYLARFAGAPWLTLMVLATKQESDVSTLGDVNVVSPGESVGLRVGFTLPGREGFHHSLTWGFDYKNFQENVIVGLSSTQSPVKYYPLSAAYGATWRKGTEGSLKLTELDAAINFHIRGTGDRAEFDTKRFGADTNYIYLRGNLAHTRDVWRGSQFFGRAQGQLASRPLLNSEQFAGGGLSTVRGYLEATALGDNGLFGTLEFRSPSLLKWWKRKDSEWRVYVFVDAGFLTLNRPLPEQESRIELASYGFGTSLQLLDYLNGSLDVGIPLISQGQTNAYDPKLTFRMWADF